MKQERDHQNIETFCAALRAHDLSPCSSYWRYLELAHHLYCDFTMFYCLMPFAALEVENQRKKNLQLLCF